MIRRRTSPPLMQGKFEDCDLQSLLEIVSIGRQFLAIEVVDDRGEEIGMILVKSGKLLGAKAGRDVDEVALRNLLSVPKQARFSVYPQPDPLPVGDVRSPVGTISDIIARASQAASLGGRDATAVERISVMHGVLREFDLLSIVQVVSLGRQLTGIEVSSPHGALIGSIVLKSGRFLSIACGSQTGVAAMRKLLAVSSDSTFAVYRTEFNEELGDGIGAIHDIILKASEPDDDEASWAGSEEAKTSRAMIRPPLPTLDAPPSDARPSEAPGFTKPGSIPVRAVTGERGLKIGPERTVEILEAICAGSRDIMGAAVISMDGSTLGTALPPGIGNDTVGATTASLFGAAQRVAAELLRDGVDQLYLRSRTGYVVVNALTEDTALVVLLRQEAKLGLVLLELKGFVDELRGIA